jgi:hypothetical protein
MPLVEMDLLSSKRGDLFFLFHSYNRLRPDTFGPDIDQTSMAFLRTFFELLHNVRFAPSLTLFACNLLG